MEEKFCTTCDEPVIDKEAPCPSQCKSPRCGAYKRLPPVHLEGKVFVWVIGGPLSGKMTLCQKIASTYGLKLLILRDLCQDEIKANTIRSKCLISIMARKELIPNDTVIYLLKKAVNEKALFGKGFVVYDFPREERQGKAFTEHIAPVDLIFYLNASDDLKFERAVSLKKEKKLTETEYETLRIRFKNYREHLRRIIPQYPHKIVELKAEKSPDENFKTISGHMKIAMDHQAKLKADREAEEATLPMLGMNLIKKMMDKARQ